MSLGGYTRLLRSPGVPRLAGAFLALGCAGTMTPVAFVLFAREHTRSFAAASLVLAASTAGGLLFGPARGRLVDRLGPRRAVLRLAAPSVATDVAFILGARAGGGTGLTIALAFVAGAVTTPAGVALRSVWADALADGDSRQAGFALMTMMQETTFIAGPLLAGLLIAVFSPTAAVAGTALLSFVGALLFAGATRDTDPPVTRPGAIEHGPAEADTPERRGRLPALHGAGIRAVVATSAAFGLTFGILDVAFPAFARSHGSVALAGILLSAFAVGSWVGGFLYGLRARATAATRLYPRLCLLAAAGLAPLIAAPPLAAMVALAALAGLCFAPITTCQLAVIDEVAPAGHRAEAFTWIGTLYGAGLALGAALAGQLISATGLRAALAAACAATLLAWALAAARLTPVATSS